MFAHALKIPDFLDFVYFNLSRLRDAIGLVRKLQFETLPSQHVPFLTYLVSLLVEALMPGFLLAVADLQSIGLFVQAVLCWQCGSSRLAHLIYAVIRPVCKLMT